jgi:hypothetical protein
VDNCPSWLSITSLPDTLVLARYLRILSDVLEILGNLLPWRFLFLACPMNNSICLVFFVYVPCH